LEPLANQLQWGRDREIAEVSFIVAPEVHRPCSRGIGSSVAFFRGVGRLLSLLSLGWRTREPADGGGFASGFRSISTVVVVFVVFAIVCL
jgi:hypothetical protein